MRRSITNGATRILYRVIGPSPKAAGWVQGFHLPTDAAVDITESQTAFAWHAAHHPQLWRTSPQLKSLPELLQPGALTPNIETVPDRRWMRYRRLRVERG